MFKETQHATSKHANDETTETIKSERNRKPKYTVKEVLKFDGDPKKWVKWIKARNTSWSKQAIKI